jgi:hypothetical protein
VHRSTTPSVNAPDTDASAPDTLPHPCAGPDLLRGRRRTVPLQRPCQNAPGR